MVSASISSAAELARPALIRHALHLTGGNQAAAEDLVQEAFVRMVEKPPQYRNRSKTKAWLILVMRHLWADRFPRKQKLTSEDKTVFFRAALQGGRGSQELLFAAGADSLDA